MIIIMCSLSRYLVCLSTCLSICPSIHLLFVCLFGCLVWIVVLNAFPKIFSASREPLASRISLVKCAATSGVFHRQRLSCWNYRRVLLSKDETRVSLLNFTWPDHPLGDDFTWIPYAVPHDIDRIYIDEFRINLWTPMNPSKFSICRFSRGLWVNTFKTGHPKKS